MMINISTEALNQRDLTLVDLGLLLYYIEPNITIDPIRSQKLWERGLLTKTLDGFASNMSTIEELNTITLYSTPKNQKNRLLELAEKLREIYPEGKKEGTPYYWRDSKQIIAQKLNNFFKKFGNYTDEEIINATKKYIETYKNNRQFMQLLKYFISKKDPYSGDLKSELLSYIENDDKGPDNWLNEVK